MSIKKPKKVDLSLKSVEWGSDEFNEIKKKANKQQEEMELYQQTIEAIKTIQGY